MNIWRHRFIGMLNGQVLDGGRRLGSGHGHAGMVKRWDFPLHLQNARGRQRCSHPPMIGAPFLEQRALRKATPTDEAAAQTREDGSWGEQSTTRYEPPTTLTSARRMKNPCCFTDATASANHFSWSSGDAPASTG